MIVRPSEQSKGVASLVCHSRLHQRRRRLSLRPNYLSAGDRAKAKSCFRATAEFEGRREGRSGQTSKRVAQVLLRPVKPTRDFLGVGISRCTSSDLVYSVNISTIRIFQSSFMYRVNVERTYRDAQKGMSIFEILRQQSSLQIARQSAKKRESCSILGTQDKHCCALL